MRLFPMPVTYNEQKKTKSPTRIRNKFPHPLPIIKNLHLAHPFILPSLLQQLRIKQNIRLKRMNLKRAITSLQSTFYSFRSARVIVACIVKHDIHIRGFVFQDFAVVEGFGDNFESGIGGEEGAAERRGAVEAGDGGFP